MKKQAGASRRKFLKTCAAGAVAGSSVQAMNGKLGLISSAMAASSDYASLTDYKALVCVFLYGGSDSFNMVMPYQPDEYANLASSRPSLLTPRDQLLPDSNAELGFNPQLPYLHSAYNAGNLAVVQNVGNLVAPITRQQYLNKSVPVPADLFAHNHQQEQWQKGWSSRPTGATSSGWGGRIADLLMTANSSDSLAPVVSVSSESQAYWGPGTRTKPLTVSPLSGLTRLSYFDGQRSAIHAEREATLNAIMRLSTDHPMQQQAASDYFRARGASLTLSDVLDQSPTFATPYNVRNDLEAQLRMVSRLIAGRQQLGMRRQIFFVTLGGWDTHDTQAQRLPLLLNQLNAGLESFQGTLNEMNIADNVTTFTASDFGRSLSVNGDGTDHGWGGHYMVLGGAVKGGQQFGYQPDYTTGGRNDSDDQGRIIPTTSINQYGAMLARWLGVSNTDLGTIFPDLNNFGNDWARAIKFLDVPSNISAAASKY